MEVWNGTWKQILVWNGRLFLYGMEMEWNKIASTEYGKTSSIPYHALSTTQVK